MATVRVRALGVNSVASDSDSDSVETSSEVRVQVIEIAYDIIRFENLSTRSQSLSKMMRYIWILATYDVVRHVRCRTSCKYDIVRATYDIVLNTVRTMSYVRY